MVQAPGVQLPVLTGAQPELDELTELITFLVWRARGCGVRSSDGTRRPGGTPTGALLPPRTVRLVDERWRALDLPHADLSDSG